MTTPPAEVTAEQARIRMKHLLDDTQHHDGRILLTRHGEPAGLLVPPYVKIPHAYDWAEARVAYDALKAYTDLPADVRRVVEALGVLLGSDTSHEPEGATS